MTVQVPISFHSYLHLLGTDHIRHYYWHHRWSTKYSDCCMW